ncbi:hypothetical protein C0J52_21561, partial [Blattella germanica]
LNRLSLSTCLTLLIIRFQFWCIVSVRVGAKYSEKKIEKKPIQLVVGILTISLKKQNGRWSRDGIENYGSLILVICTRHI